VCGGVRRLLQDPRVRATVDVQNRQGGTVLFPASSNRIGTSAASIIHHLLQAGINPAITNYRGETPLAYLRQHHPSHHADQAPDAEKASLLVKARRLAVAAISITVAPSCLQGRVARGQPLPRLLLRRVMVTPMTGGPDEEEEEDRALRTMMAFLLGKGGPKGEGMPRDVFRVDLGPAAAEECGNSSVGATGLNGGVAEKLAAMIVRREWGKRL